MRTFRTILLAAVLAAVLAAPAVAAAADAPAVPARASAAELPEILSNSERGNYRQVFAAIRSQDWLAASALLDGTREGPLHNAARARLYVAPGSPRVELDPLVALLGRAPELPQAPQLVRLAQTRGATALPALPEVQRLVGQAGQPRRGRARNVRGEPAAAELEALVQPLIVADQPHAAEALFNERESSLSVDARTEFQQRIAWSYYLTGNDRAARSLADKARRGGGEWVIHSEWVSGLASWRMQDCSAASEAFANVGARSTDPELMAAGQYWAARADMMCARPERIQARLRTASRLGETFYGMLAASALGVSQSPIAHDAAFTRADWRLLADRPNVRAAVAASEIGERALADELIRHQARIGAPREHEALLHLAERLNLPATQLWLAHNAPRGASVAPLDRYPSPDWRPNRGWRVDQSLVFAHALQESNFRPDAVSPAGAQGLMQVRPGTAGDIARRRGEAAAGLQLTDPATNIEFGQSYLEYLRDLGGTGGLLPKVIAAYNAGPSPIAEWNTRGRDRGDPLLYIESIPYWETRGYVPIVLRNYWIYEQRAGQASSSRSALAQGMWPRFPGMPGAAAVRVASTAGGGAMGTQ